ncbi:hypothetical protein [Nonlabens dokdonensis]|uniref:Uncharacterized protein n=2 Tax=Nonlabens dokdonensis TaxID=328515 RepID=L7W7W5_NONDD|nr:hypothetical protein [Nonlabens dokdonensis]AGC76287.1 hypothetical protein DDD_1160 [Nonlabens dokdonensis DSW-6]
MLMAIIVDAQVNYLVLENAELNETHILEDNQNVRVVTEDGKRYNGRMLIIDEKTIKIKGDLIPLEHIWKIKKHSRLVSVLFGIVIVYVSLVTIGAGILIATYGGEVALGTGVGLIGGFGMYGGINGVNLSKAYKSDRGWTFSVGTAAAVPVLGG